MNPILKLIICVPDIYFYNKKFVGEVLRIYIVAVT